MSAPHPRPDCAFSIALGQHKQSYKDLKAAYKANPSAVDLKTTIIRRDAVRKRIRLLETLGEGHANFAENLSNAQLIRFCTLSDMQMQTMHVSSHKLGSGSSLSSTEALNVRSFPVSHTPDQLGGRASVHHTLSFAVHGKPISYPRLMSSRGDPHFTYVMDLEKYTDMVAIKPHPLKFYQSIGTPLAFTFGHGANQVSLKISCMVGHTVYFSFLRPDGVTRVMSIDAKTLMAEGRHNIRIMLFRLVEIIIKMVGGDFEKEMDEKAADPAYLARFYNWFLTEGMLFEITTSYKHDVSHFRLIKSNELFSKACQHIITKDDPTYLEELVSKGLSLDHASLLSVYSQHRLIVGTDLRGRVTVPDSLIALAAYHHCVLKQDRTNIIRYLLQQKVSLLNHRRIDAAVGNNRVSLKGYDVSSVLSVSTTPEFKEALQAYSWRIEKTNHFNRKTLSTIFINAGEEIKPTLPMLAWIRSELALQSFTDELQTLLRLLEERFQKMCLTPELLAFERRLHALRYDPSDCAHMIQAGFQFLSALKVAGVADKFNEVLSTVKSARALFDRRETAMLVMNYKNRLFDQSLRAVPAAAVAVPAAAPAPVVPSREEAPDLPMADIVKLPPSLKSSTGFRLSLAAIEKVVEGLRLASLVDMDKVTKEGPNITSRFIAISGSPLSPADRYVMSIYSLSQKKVAMINRGLDELFRLFLDSILTPEKTELEYRVMLAFTAVAAHLQEPESAILNLEMVVNMILLSCRRTRVMKFPHAEFIRDAISKLSPIMPQAKQRHVNMLLLGLLDSVSSEVFFNIDYESPFFQGTMRAFSDAGLISVCKLLKKSGKEIPDLLSQLIWRQYIRRLPGITTAEGFSPEYFEKPATDGGSEFAILDKLMESHTPIDQWPSIHGLPEYSRAFLYLSCLKSDLMGLSTMILEGIKHPPKNMMELMSVLFCALPSFQKDGHYPEKMASVLSVVASSEPHFMQPALLGYLLREEVLGYDALTAQVASQHKNSFGLAARLLGQHQSGYARFSQFLAFPKLFEMNRFNIDLQLLLLLVSCASHAEFTAKATQVLNHWPIPAVHHDACMKGSIIPRLKQEARKYIPAEVDIALERGFKVMKSLALRHFKSFYALQRRYFDQKKALRLISGDQHQGCDLHQSSLISANKAIVEMLARKYPARGSRTPYAMPAAFKTLHGYQQFELLDTYDAVARSERKDFDAAISPAVAKQAAPLATDPESPVYPVRPVRSKQVTPATPAVSSLLTQNVSTDPKTLDEVIDLFERMLAFCADKEGRFLPPPDRMRHGVGASYTFFFDPRNPHGMFSDFYKLTKHGEQFSKLATELEGMPPKTERHQSSLQQSLAANFRAYWRVLADYVDAGYDVKNVQNAIKVYAKRVIEEETKFKAFYMSPSKFMTKTGRNGHLAYLMSQLRGGPNIGYAAFGILGYYDVTNNYFGRDKKRRATYSRKTARPKVDHPSQPALRPAEPVYQRPSFVPPVIPAPASAALVPVPSVFPAASAAPAPAPVPASVPCGAPSAAPRTLGVGLLPPVTPPSHAAMSSGSDDEGSSGAKRRHLNSGGSSQAGSDGGSAPARESVTPVAAALLTLKTKNKKRRRKASILGSGK